MQTKYNIIVNGQIIGSFTLAYPLTVDERFTLQTTFSNINRTNNVAIEIAE